MDDKKVVRGELICHDCGKSLQKGDEYVSYKAHSGNFYKCKACYKQDSILRNFQKCEVYSRIVGYIRPVEQWNVGKTEEYQDRKEFVVQGA